MSKMKPSVSILIPAYNAKQWLPDALRSALAQSWDRKEIIVVNDGSKDQTEEVAFRTDAAFGKPEIYGALESLGVKYTICIPANENLEQDADELEQCKKDRERRQPMVDWCTADRQNGNLG